MPQIENFFEEVSCNFCGSNTYDIALKQTLTEKDILLSSKLAIPQDPTIKTARIVRCRQCGLCYANPRPCPELLRVWYREISDPRHLEEMPYRVRSAFPILRRIRRFSFGNRLLDIGCYTGFFLKAAQEDGWDIQGLEPSEWAARYAREKLHLSVKTGTLEETDFRGAAFDVITMFHVLEHAIDPKSILKRVHSLLAPNGLVVIEVPDIESLAARLLRERWWSLRPVHLYYFSPKTLSAYLEQSGFQVEWKGAARTTLSLGYLSSRLQPYLGRFSETLTQCFRLLRLHKIAVPLKLGDFLLVVARKKEDRRSSGAAG